MRLVTQRKTGILYRARGKREHMRKMMLAFVAVALSLPALAANPKIYITPDNGFETDIIAGIQKKSVPVIVVNDQTIADYTLTANTVTIHQESTGGKIARCLFAYCAGIEDSGNVSVQLLDNHNKAIVWAYNVAKQTGKHNRQSMAEAIAKHLNNDYFKKHK
jgi:hypothetical protein